jgi:predicted Na+-dependent transporter
LNENADTGALASTIALNILHSPRASATGVVFVTWHNVSGAILAGFWKRKPANKSAVTLGTTPAE